ncbi:MAG: hypothetical protein US86_C0008G0024 [Candidatus Daviesbacteria bacterium GW2011_GWA2_38_24]|uniref:Uncharacterized protein n=1 Tax=Candidatus Daviesbacteria bacterium GW2011_GWA2_38_24 TaxID=1618422 RepID=A0A0G0MLJ9_9BACT|nr:MAG: hypothetical protein US86_C0008G0024 [Candidatus Daviesbacteria bacterium GW2011_GWA2_38_24]KKQ80575.1 MAG: hypothetical protein UT01_C0009G0003 [Candidatus Daviesbacteria bacterium GW2011_GWA1_38_7]OGE23731.1 MAG: hypothetical protein A2688_02090 [Candidatus Daviesbacteria bacterium RIFCSPHIGHO2_01_FULL_38_8]
MTLTAHALVGAALAASFSNPAIGIPLAVISHPILDMIPHWDFGRGWRKKTKLRLVAESSIDLFIGCALSFLLFSQNVVPWYFWSAVFAAIFWDIATAPYLMWNWKFPPFNLLYQMQSKWQGRASLTWGIIYQVVTVFGVIWLLSSFK